MQPNFAVKWVKWVALILGRCPETGHSEVLLVKAQLDGAWLVE
jgi:hypothetical protein